MKKRYNVHALIEKIENELALTVASENRNRLQEIYDNLVELEANGVESVVLGE